MLGQMKTPGSYRDVLLGIFDDNREASSKTDTRKAQRDAEEFCDAHRSKDEEAFMGGLKTLIERRGPNQVREIAEAVRQIGSMELTEMTSAIIGPKNAVAYNAFSK
jgi:hypothetical protein